MNFFRIKFRNLCFFLSGFLKRDSNMLIFGAWFGERLSDNSKAVLDYIVNEYPDEYKLYWIGKESLRELVEQEYKGKVDFLIWNSFKAYKIILKSKYMFVTSGYNDFGKINLSRKAVIVQLWHGFPLKKIAADTKDRESDVYRYYSQYSYFLSTSAIMTNRINSGFRYYGINSENILNVGQPRNDKLLSITTIEKQKIMLLRKEWGIAENELIAIYMPTFRDNTSEVFSFSNISLNYKNKLKENGIHIIEKQHYARKNTIIREGHSAVSIAGEDIDTQLLLKISDILITDYSSIFVDYLLLNRPIIHFLYDNDEYEKKDRGIYSSSFIDDSAGPIVANIAELVNCLIDMKETDSFEELRNKQCQKFNEYHVQSNAATIFNLLLEKERD